MIFSIIIPVYNEDSKIASDIEEADLFLKRNEFSGEIIVVDDGSTDKTKKVVEAADSSILKLVSYTPNRGKGYAVKKGIMEAKGELILFIDSGLCIPYDEVLKGYKLIRSNTCDIAHASRFLPQSRILRKKNKFRRFLSWVFRRSVKFMMNIPDHLTDTQCGLKMYRNNIAKELYQKCETEGFLFDIEIILRADNAGYRICEFPVTWISDPDSRLALSRNIFRMLKELKRIKKI